MDEVIFIISSQDLMEFEGFVLLAAEPEGLLAALEQGWWFVVGVVEQAAIVVVFGSMCFDDIAGHLLSDWNFQFVVRG